MRRIDLVPGNGSLPDDGRIDVVWEVSTVGDGMLRQIRLKYGRQLE